MLLVSEYVPVELPVGEAARTTPLDRRGSSIEEVSWANRFCRKQAAAADWELVASEGGKTIASR